MLGPVLLDDEHEREIDQDQAFDGILEQLGQEVC